MRILDNKTEKLYTVLKDSIKQDSKLSILTAHFTLAAFNELKVELNNVDSARFIFGDATDNYLKELSENCNETIFTNKLQNTRIAKEFASWLKDKADVNRIDQPVFSKLLHIEGKENNSELIQGGMNFDAAGLGVIASNDFNNANMQLIDDSQQAKQMSQQFENIWNTPTIRNVKDALLDRLDLLSKDHDAEFLYFYTLYTVFKDYMEELENDRIFNDKTGFKESKVWNMLYKFQKDGVIGAIQKIEKYNGCIIADSVGLGKTFEALAVIKYYENRNYRVLVLCPKKLRENWSVYKSNVKGNILETDRLNYEIYNHTDLKESGFSGDQDVSQICWGNYDLVVIDESHNFRNNKIKKERLTRYDFLMQKIIKDGAKTKLLMLTATPVNNGVNDLRNQIYFITEGKDDVFKDYGIESLKQTSKRANRNFKEWMQLEKDEKSTDSLVNTLDPGYFKLLDMLTIARSRKHIEEFYDVSELGNFPKRLIPINKGLKRNANSSYDVVELNDIMSDLNLAIFKPMTYVLANKRAEYEKKYDNKVQGKGTLRQTDRETSLIKLMKVNYLKRLESSIDSFGKSIVNLRNKIFNTIELLEKNSNNIKINAQVNKVVEETNDTRIEEAYIANKLEIKVADMDALKWIPDLKADLEKLDEILTGLSTGADSVDSKLEELKAIIENKIQNPINEGNKKVLVFTAFSDTAEYLYENISFWAEKKFGLKTALVTGSANPKTNYKGLKNNKIKVNLNSVLTCFSPISKHKDKAFPNIEGEIDILIGTDCISEGQNLQDCDYLVNYDIHWNPVRIIQRFGRIDRIGSKNTSIQLVNFWPDMELDEYINLEKRVSGKLALLGTAAAGDEELIEEEITGSDLDYRREQLEHLQTAELDLSEVQGGVSITDMSFNGFKSDISNKIEDKEYLKRLENFPKACFAVVEASNDEDKGVIFCLKDKKGESENIRNTFDPYFMIFVGEAGQIKKSFTNSKNILELFGKFAKGNKSAITELVNSFNTETNDKSDMSKYVSLLEDAVEHINGGTKEAGIKSIFTPGEIVLNNTDKGIEDFEVISYLIIK